MIGRTLGRRVRRQYRPTEELLGQPTGPQFDDYYGYEDDDDDCYQYPQAPNESGNGTNPTDTTGTAMFLQEFILCGSWNGWCDQDLLGCRRQGRRRNHWRYGNDCGRDRRRRQGHWRYRNDGGDIRDWTHRRTDWDDCWRERDRGGPGLDGCQAVTSVPHIL